MLDIITGFFSNPIGAVTAMVSGLVIWKVALFFYQRLAPVGLILKQLQKPLNHAAYRIYGATEKIKDTTLKTTLRNDLDKLGNDLDTAWDAGLRGEKW